MFSKIICQLSNDEIFLKIGRLFFLYPHQLNKFIIVPFRYVCKFDSKPINLKIILSIKLLKIFHKFENKDKSLIIF